MDAGMEALLLVIKQRVKSKISEIPRVQALLDKINSGNATFADTAEYSEIVSNALGTVFSSSIPELSEAGLKEYVCTELLKDRYNDTNEVLATVQKSLDEKAGVKLAPQKAVFPLDRVTRVAHSLADATVKEDVIARRANGPVANVSKSFHDDYIEENAKFRNDAGLKCYISRVTDGKCCKWCSAIAGRYEYSEAPEDIYRRHDNCGCTVTYENGRTRQDVWSKKTWEVPEVKQKNSTPKKLSYEQGKAIEQQNLPRIGVDKSGGSGIIEESSRIVKKAVTDVHSVGKIDIKKYKCITNDITTDEVIITDERIQHIKDRHPNDYEKYYKYMSEVILSPEYIIEANKPNTALILKSFSEGEEQFKTVLRLVASTDDSKYKNSIITFMKINDKEWQRIIRNKKILYKSE